jgi:hypothetical protein
MSLTNVTPSTGVQRPVAVRLNRLRLRPGDRVVYWSDAAAAVKIDTIDAYASQDGNYFAIDGERVIVIRIWARAPQPHTPEDCTAEQDAAVIADFAAYGRSVLSIFEIMDVCDKHGLAS